METVEIEREKLDQLIRSALVAENEGLQPPDHVWQRILRRADHLDNRPVFGTAARAEQPQVLVTSIS